MVYCRKQKDDTRLTNTKKTTLFSWQQTLNAQYIKDFMDYTEIEAGKCLLLEG